MEFFLNPWYMVAGGALVSAPILIHLINRMRFKRIRWAAMEFLLKSQKRNRRRLIIEQLILLALRCLLVLLAGFLVARYVGAMGPTSEGTTHYVVLDDTPSMGDHHQERGPVLTAMDVAKDQIKLLAKNAAQAPSHQEMKVFLLSDLDTSIYSRRLSDRSSDELHSAMATLKPSSLHTSPLKALEKAAAFFNDIPKGQKIVHFVSDFRDTDWVTGPKVEEINQAITRLNEAGVNVSFIDTAHPFRSATRQVAQHHDNWAITDFRCETHVAVENVDTEFTMVVHNFGASDKPRFVKVYVDGTEDFRATRLIPNIPPGDRREEKFILNLIKKRPSPIVQPGDSREERERKRQLDREFVHIQAQLEPEETGLAADNIRDLVVEVRRKVPTLVVDGSGPEGRQPGGDYFHFETAFEASNLYEIQRCTADQLDTIPLELYPSMVLLNVGEIKSEKTLQKLRDYVQHGGSIAYFLGDKARPGFYNELYKKHEGLFPLLIGATAYNSVDPNGNLSEEDREEKRKDKRQNDPQPKILFRDPSHPLVATLAPYTSAFRYLGIDIYHRAQPRFQWEAETPSATKAEEIVLLPNNHSIDDYKERAQELGRQALEQTKALAEAEKDYAKFTDQVDRLRTGITNALAKPYLFNLVRALDDLLKLQATDKGIDMAVLWAHPKMLPLKAQIDAFRDTVMYGDPLVVGRNYGKGRVVAVLTSAGTSSKWNDWGGGSLASFSYEVFLMDLQRWMTAQGDDLNRVVGDSIKMELGPDKYQPKVKRKFLPQPDPDAPADGKNQPVTEDQGEQVLPLKNGMLMFDFQDAKRPGMFVFELFPIAAKGTGPTAETELRAYAFNVDAQRESDLRRAARDKLERPKAGKDSRSGTVSLRAPGDNFDAFKERRPDASESPWLYLLFLVILVVEQALAVHLSFHLKGNEAAPPASAGGRTHAPAPQPETAGA